MSTTTTTPRAPERDRDALRTILAHLESLADTRPDDDPEKLATFGPHWPGQASLGRWTAGVSRPGTVPVKACAIDPATRAAVAPFLDSWVIGPLRAVLADLDGADDFATQAHVRQVGEEAR